jgi:hypothetical protein
MTPDASPDAAQAPQAAERAPVESKVIHLPRITVLSRLDVSRTIDAKIYDQRKEEYQGKLAWQRQQALAAAAVPAKAA